ncbi:MAG: hypothetical protein JJE13_07195 [Thermoleophilia bacterium]|nr:hypothetical protein [Thermoleophilia bacterium]
MRRIATAVMIAGTLALTAAPAVASQPDHPKGPPADKAAKAKAYGKFCQDQSKKHVKGVKGTPFSACVKAMNQLAKTEADGGNAAPREVCKDLSKKHVKGEKGTPFSRCVVGAQELKRELRETATA